MEDQITRIEEQIAFQEDLIQKLDHALSDQQKQLIAAERKIEFMMQQLRKLEADNSMLTKDERPPHY